VANAFARQEQSEMTFVKRENWTEDQINELPSGEHDYFDRKSGNLFDAAADRNNLFDTLAKAASAFVNSGGGHLILGVSDAGNFEGVPRLSSGRTTTRDWLEQKLPQLLDYRLSDFRVHVVVRSGTSRIPEDRDVIVLDFGDSALAPHQSARDHTYYYRSGGRSLPAPHFYLELLRQRLTSPSLEFELTGADVDAWLHEGLPMLRIDAKFMVENKGRIAAYKWALVARTLDGIPEERGDDYLFQGIPGATARTTSIRVDDTILPGCACAESKVFGIRLRPKRLDEEGIKNELNAMLFNLKLTLQLPTENSPGASKEVDFTPFIDADRIIEMLKSKGLTETAESFKGE
jgi:hypothetical protein